MAQGGPRPDAGRRQTYRYFVKGKDFNNLKDAADANGVTLPTVHKWCTGKRTDCWREKISESKTKSSPPLEKDDTPEDISVGESKPIKITPLDYMLNIMSDDKADKDRRDKMAYWAAPYVHGKASEKKGKKETEQDKAGKAGGGKFGTAKPPALKRVK